MDKTGLTINILSPSLFFILVSLVYYFSRNKLSSNLFLISLYTVLIVVLFFTYGSYIEKVSIKNQINYIIDEQTSTLQSIIKSTTSGINFSDNDLIKSIPPQNKNLDDETKKNNTKALYEAIIFASVVFIIGVSLSYLLWKKNGKNTFSIMVYHNLIILVFVFIVELVYFACLSKNYRSMKTNEIYYNFYDELVKYSNINS